MAEAPILPKYYQVEQLLRRRLAGLGAGANLPSEPELAKEYAVSRETVRSAIRTLASEGLLHRVQGRGTFVVQPKLDFPLGYHERSPDPQVDELPVHRVVTFARKAAGASWSGTFGVAEREKLLEVTRVTSFKGIPMGVGSLMMPYSLAPNLRRADFQRGRFFYTLMDHGVPISRYRLTVESVVIDPELAATAQLRAGLPGLGVTRIGYADDGTVLAVVDVVTRGDMAQYVMEFDANTVTENPTPLL